MKGQVVTKWDSYSLDASTFEHAGTRYYIWAQVEPGKTGTNIMIAKMASPTTLTGDQVILSRPTNAWETAGGVWVNEEAGIGAARLHPWGAILSWPQAHGRGRC